MPVRVMIERWARLHDATVRRVEYLQVGLNQTVGLLFCWSTSFQQVMRLCVICDCFTNPEPALPPQF